MKRFKLAIYDEERDKKAIRYAFFTSLVITAISIISKQLSTDASEFVAGETLGHFMLLMFLTSIVFLSKRVRTFLISEKKVKETSSPFKQALFYSKKPFIGVIIIALGLKTGGKEGSEVMLWVAGMLGGLAFIIFPLLWLFLYIKDKGITSDVKDMVKEKIDHVSKQQESKEMHNTADTILKYHEMLEKGIIDKEEFNDIKNKLLNK